ncbi:hypothetical protein JTB14_017366 [Gonioctena quinquepunctata]|nr:hypothetical protein JTB14_017366 [Gonioctena quinquepunctata]
MPDRIGQRTRIQWISVYLTMGFVWSALGIKKTGRTDDPDPVTGLTSREKYLIKSSYEAVRKNPVEHGVGILNLLFKKYPEALELFPFRDIPLNELPNNPRYRAHCNSVIYGFTAIVDALDNNELLVTILTKVGETHVPRNVFEESFTQLEGIVIEYFSPLLNGEELAAWDKTLKVAFNVIRGAVTEEMAKKSKS